MDLSKIREQFPILQQYPELVYLDSAATTQKPQVVLDALQEFYILHNANVHRGVYELSERATQMYELSRATVAQFLGAQQAEEIVFVRNATEGLNLLAEILIPEICEQGDVVVTTVLEHHSNFLPWWRVAEQNGVEVVVIGLTDEGEINLAEYKKVMKERKPKLASFAHAANTLGYLLPVAEMIDMAQAVGCLTILDACQTAARMPINVQELSSDFLVFSGHKHYGPTGIGCVYGRHELWQQLPPYQVGGGMVQTVEPPTVEWGVVPDRFEAGTPHIAGAYGLAAACQFIEEIGRDKLKQHDQELVAYARAKLATVSGIKIFGAYQNDQLLGSISFLINGVHAYDLVGHVDATSQVCLRAGTHCTQPLLQALGVDSTIRMSFGVYSTKEEIDKAVVAIEEAVRTLT